MLRFLIHRGVLIIIVTLMIGVAWFYADNSPSPIHFSHLLREEKPIIPREIQDSQTVSTADSSSMIELSFPSQANNQVNQESGLDMAEAQYRAILTVSDDPDAYCELGHILLMRHQEQEASEVYAKAVEIFIAQNRLSQAQVVIEILNRLNPIYAQQEESN